MKILFLFLLFAFLGVVINLTPVQKSVLPYLGNVDAQTYIELSHNIQDSYVNDLDIFGFILGGLNWFSLPYLLYAINIEEGYWRMAIVNGVVLFLIIIQLVKLGRGLIISPSLYTVLCLLLLPYLWCWLFIPSKENFTVLGFLILFNHFRGERQNRFFLFIACVCGIMKSQILASIVFRKVLRIAGRYYFISTLLFINIGTILVNLLFPNALSVELYLSVIPEEIHSADLIQKIDALVQIPIIGVLGVLLRLALYMIGGISTIKQTTESFESFLMAFPSFCVGILSCIAAPYLVKGNSRDLKIFWTFLAIFLFIPFIQFRYFWWTVPVLLHFIFSRRQASEPTMPVLIPA